MDNKEGLPEEDAQRKVDKDQLGDQDTNAGTRIEMTKERENSGVGPGNEGP